MKADEKMKILDKMSKEQLDFISGVISQNLNANFLLNYELTIEQMQVIVDGLKEEKRFYLPSGRIVRCYSDTHQNVFTAQEMRNTLNKIVEEYEQSYSLDGIINNQKRAMLRSLTMLDETCPTF